MNGDSDSAGVAGQSKRQDKELRRPALDPGLRRDERGWGYAVAVCAIVLIAATAALAQERTPAQRQQLVDLARVLGESHALGQACDGADEQFWRTRMQALLQQEAAEQGLKTRLSVAFNDGYHSAQALYPRCSDAARAEARKIAGAGEVLSGKLAGP
jgi:uncharacterized protein (TIGR02301 family)